MIWPENSILKTYKSGKELNKELESKETAPIIKNLR